ncbi:MAG: pantoate--beta-alanine ligase [Phycisphaerales bacterium]|nr:MAG: pantoate--beta-alanine ligase [Phycisphaerales bacterium]
MDAKWRRETVGLVPTMGALHEGHLSLIRASRQRCNVTVVTIFVNPKQFGPNEDLDAYPRPLEKDLEACRAEGVDVVFVPSVEKMYPPDSSTDVHVARVSEGLCGAHRPGHFDGVTTVVLKLFNILPADVAFFGEKDYQQLMVIKRMVRDLDVPIEIVGCPIVREPDGLAMSSRNVYLSEEERKQAGCLSRSLFDAVRHVRSGERNCAELTRRIRQQIEMAGPSTIDYIEIVDAETLEPLATVDRLARICLAVRIGPARLIDNIGVDPSAEAG